jgi:hypothetical protein
MFQEGDTSSTIHDRIREKELIRAMRCVGIRFNNEKRRSARLLGIMFVFACSPRWSKSLIIERREGTAISRGGLIIISTLGAVCPINELRLVTPSLVLEREIQPPHGSAP